MLTRQRVLLLVSINNFFICQEICSAVYPLLKSVLLHCEIICRRRFCIFLSAKTAYRVNREEQVALISMPRFSLHAYLPLRKKHHEAGLIPLHHAFLKKWNPNKEGSAAEPRNF